VRNKTLAIFGVVLVAITAWAAVPVIGSIINAETGFQVNSAAPSGQVICGDGTVGTYTASCPIHAASADSYSGGTLADVTGSRSIGSTFTNSGSTPIYVSGYVTTTVGGDTSQVTGTVNGLTVWSQQANATVVGSHDAFAFMVPPGGTYSITTSGTTTFTLGSWTEFTY